VTFWLGVAVEGRRADKNEAEADQARQDEQEARQDQIEAQADLAETVATAKATLAQVKAAVRHAQSVTQVAPSGGTEELGSLGVGGATVESVSSAGDPFASAFAAIESAEQQLQER
jgi:DNA-binding XRE family transcriptional regulator